MSATDDLAARLAGLPGPQAPLAQVAEVPVSEHAIRTWCAAIGEDDPIHHDASAARAAGYADVVAPPAMLQTWTMPIGHGAGTAPTLHARVRAAARDAGLSAVVATDYEQDYLQPIHPGTVLTGRSWIDAVSPPKDTALGRGQFVTIAFEIVDEQGTPVGRMRARTLYFDPATAAPVDRPRPAPKAPEAPTLAPLRIPIDRTFVIAASLASNDHEAVHHDHDVAHAQGLDDIIVSIVSTAGLVLRYTGAAFRDWRCRSLALRLASPAYPGDVLRFEGSVATEGTEAVVRARGDHARGRHVAAVVTYARR